MGGRNGHERPEERITVNKSITRRRGVLRDVRGVGRSRGRAGRDAGMATAEYAIATLAACGFAALLLALLRGSEVRELLLGIITRALSVT